MNPSHIDPALVRFAEASLGPLRTIEQVDNGLVHLVYRIQAERTAYLKVRGSTFAKVPSMRISPKDIIHEKTALEIFSRAVPGLFPEVLGFDAGLSALLLSDVVAGGETLNVRCASDAITSSVATQIGAAIGATHDALRDSPIAIRPDDDAAYFEYMFSDRMLRFNHPRAHSAALAFIEELRAAPRQLVNADVSPKNIAVHDDGSVRFFDLECAHRGNTMMDLGFFLGHLFLHGGANGDGLVRDALRGYRVRCGAAIDEPLLTKAIGLTVAYRLRNETSPYPVQMPTRDADAVVARACEMLEGRWAVR